MNIEKIKDKVFQAVMSDIGKHYKVSDRLSDILCDSLSEHLPTSITQALAEERDRVRGVIEKPLGIVADFVERWNKQDKEKDVAQAIEELLSIKKLNI